MSSFFNLLIWNVTLATGLAIAIAVAGCLPALQRRPALRHWLWLLVLVKLVTPPLIPLPILPSADAASGTERAQAAEEISISQMVPLSTPIDAAPTESDPVDFSPRENAADPPAATPAQALAAVPGSSGVDWLLLLPTALLLVTVLLLTRSIVQMIRLLRLLARCNNHDRRVSDIAAREAAKMELHREPTVALVSARMTPLLLVMRRGPTIVLPTALVAQLDDEQLACVIRHELAHFVRRDHCANAIAFVVASLFWWHPVAWWARREMRLAQESCCDAMVFESAPQLRRCYAETLLHVIDFLGVQSSPLPHLAAGFGEARSLKRRFEMLANERVTHRLSRLAKGLVACGVIALSCYPVLAQSVAETQESAAGESRTDNVPQADSGPTDGGLDLRSFRISAQDPATGATDVGKRPDAQKTRRVYFLQFADARQVHEVLSAIKQPDAVVEVEARTNQVVVEATEPQHRELAEVIKQLDLKEPPKSLAVIKMTRSDPKAVLIVVRKMFEGTTENAPRVDVDLAGRRLFVRGTPAQVRQVRNLIVGLEQLISGPGDQDDAPTGVAASTIPQAAPPAEDGPFALPAAAPRATGLPESAKVTTDGAGNVVGVKLTGESNLNRSAVTPEIVDALAKLKSLRTLSLWGTTVGDREIERFTALKQLQLIDLSFTDVTGESLRALASLKKLVSVRLEGCDVKDEHLITLGDMPQLAMLYLGRTRITDLGLKHIKQLEHLNLLQLSDCQITDQGLASLGHLPRIQHLWLSKTIRNGDDDRSDLTDRSIDYLISLDTLVDLQIADSQLTESGLQRLREGLPKADVNTKRTGITYRSRAAK